MHRSLMPVALALAASLSACGGGGGSGGPSSLPAPPPAPPAEPPTNDTLTDLTVDQTFATASSTLAVGASADGVAITSASKSYGTGISVAYDASSDSYTLSQGAASGVFGPGDITETTSYSTAYEVADGSQSDIFIRFNAGAGNTTLQLTYASYGGWLDFEDMPGGISLAARFFVYGIKTADGDMPRSGTASYHTVVDGIWMEDTDIYAIGGDSAFSANFADGTVSTRLDLTGQNVSTGNLRPFGVFEGGGTLTGTSSAFEGSMGSSSSSYSGVFNGAFFGPGAREMGYTFELTNGVNGAAVGAVVGHQ